MLYTSGRECYTQSEKVDERVSLLGGIQVHLQPTLLLMYRYKELSIHVLKTYIENEMESQSISAQRWG